MRAAALLFVLLTLAACAHKGVAPNTALLNVLVDEVDTTLFTVIEASVAGTASAQAAVSKDHR